MKYQMGPQLPVLPRPVSFAAHYFTEDQLRAYALRAILEERERISRQVLQHAKYHAWPADEHGPEDYEIFSPDIDCSECVDVVILPASAISNQDK